MPAKQTSPQAALKDYRKKRDFRATPEPAAANVKAHARPIFVIQEHHATRLHFDFRLEADGVLKSWAVTNEPTMDPAVKRLAVRVEDHPLAYAKFAGDIPEGHYGAGHVEIWDRGTYELDSAGRRLQDELDAGKTSFILHGKKLNGRFALVRMRGKSGKKENWLLIKAKDEFARSAAAETPSAAKAPVMRARLAKRSTAAHSLVIGKPPKGRTRRPGVP